METNDWGEGAKAPSGFGQSPTVIHDQYFGIDVPVSTLETDEILSILEREINFRTTVTKEQVFALSPAVNALLGVGVSLAVISVAISVFVWAVGPMHFSPETLNAIKENVQILLYAGNFCPVLYVLCLLVSIRFKNGLQYKFIFADMRQECARDAQCIDTLSAFNAEALELVLSVYVRNMDALTRRVSLLGGDVTKVGAVSVFVSVALLTTFSLVKTHYLAFSSVVYIGVITGAFGLMSLYISVTERRRNRIKDILGQLSLIHISEPTRH